MSSLAMSQAVFTLFLDVFLVEHGEKYKMRMTRKRASRTSLPYQFNEVPVTVRLTELRVKIITMGNTI